MTKVDQSLATGPANISKLAIFRLIGIFKDWFLFCKSFWTDNEVKLNIYRTNRHMIWATIQERSHCHGIYYNWT